MLTGFDFKIVLANFSSNGRDLLIFNKWKMTCKKNKTPLLHTHLDFSKYSLNH